MLDSTTTSPGRPDRAWQVDAGGILSERIARRRERNHRTRGRSGKEYPAEWRNDEWEFATYTADGQRRTGSLQSCFECHKPVGDAGFDYAYAVGVMR